MTNRHQIRYIITAATMCVAVAVAVLPDLATSDETVRTLEASRPVIATVEDPIIDAGGVATIDGAVLAYVAAAERAEEERVWFAAVQAEEDRQAALAAEEEQRRREAAAAAETATQTETAPPVTTAPASAGSVWDRLAACESNGNWSINTGNGYFGGLQFNLSTWQSYGGSGYPHQNSRAEQIRVAENLRAARGFQPWPACSRKLGLR